MRVRRSGTWRIRPGSSKHLFLAEQLAGYRIFDPEYRILFNSYYKALGSHPARQQRGGFSRPSFSNVLRYREHVDEAMNRLLAKERRRRFWRWSNSAFITSSSTRNSFSPISCTHSGASRCVRPTGRRQRMSQSQVAAPLRWIEHPGGVVEIGAGGEGFAFDNERPRHAVLLAPYRLASRLATNGEYLDFINDKGYQRPELWLSDGWDTVCREGWQAPLYWEKMGETWCEFTLRGMNPVNPAAPVNHVSYYEADAFARWSGARLPLESEWEDAARKRTVCRKFAGELEAWNASSRAGGRGGRGAVVWGSVGVDG